MSTISQVVNQNSILSRVTHESKVDMSGVVNEKDLRVKGQDQDNYVNLASSQNQEAQDGDQQFAHQHHIAFNAYRFYARNGEEAAKPQENAAEKIEEIKEQLFPQTNKSKSEENTGVETNAQQKQDKEQKVDDKQSKRAQNGKELSEEDLEKIEDLKDRDREVRIHEQAHKSAGGSYASAPKYDFVTGPDGRRYADSGHVDIDVSEEKDPEDTIAKMQVVKRAALAPQEPSGQDRKVFAQASQKEAQARQELSKLEKEEAESKKEEAAAATNTQMSAVQTPQQKREAEENTNTARRADIIKEGAVDNKIELKPKNINSHMPQKLAAGKELDNNSIMSEGKNA